MYFTNVIREVDLQSLDQEPFLHQLLIQRFNGPGDRAHRPSVSTHGVTAFLLIVTCAENFNQISTLKRLCIHADKWIFEAFLQFGDESGFLKTILSLIHVYV